MKKTTFLSVLALLAAITACTTSSTRPQVNLAIDEQHIQPDDSTRYGLACDGCTDSILVFLPNSGGDPDTFNILEASLNHRIYGRPNVGDRVAIVINHEDSTTADMLINLDRLTGEWTYEVMPELRQRAGAEKAGHERHAALPDSFRKKFMVPRQLGFVLNADGTARGVSTVPRTQMGTDSPVKYPRQKHYREWRILNGQLLLNEAATDSLGQLRVVSIDTAQFVLMRRDTLVLRFNDGEQGYSRTATTKER